MGVRETGIWLGALIYFLVFLATVAGSIQDPRGIELQKRSIFQWSSSIVISVFFFFAYVFLIMTLQQRPPAFLGAKVLGIICLVVFYLPLRFFLLLRPPAARSEYVLFLLVFGYLLYELSAKT
jgi:Mn2+/Fe2+ NRAMP family transporter